MNYQEAHSYLDGLQMFKIKLGLGSMTRFLDEAGRPQGNLKFVHVAGTNGKGSVSVTLLSILAAAGYKVGLFTSPHLSSVRERFRINNRFISREEFAGIAGRIHEILAGRRITYFEFCTALAMLWFSREEVDLAIMETGMGGRLDATNVVQPLVSVITNVSMDHEEYLGATLTAVAEEKAGIIKPGVPVVSGVAEDFGLGEVTGKCMSLRAPLYLLGRDFTGAADGERSWTYTGCNGFGRSLSGLPRVLRGSYQIANAALALAALDLLAGAGFMIEEEVIRSGMKEVRWPGRLEVCRGRYPPEACGNNADDRAAADNGAVRTYLLDGAHNPAGVEVLRNVLTTEFKNRRLVLLWGSMSDKKTEAMLPVIAPLCDRIILVKPHGDRAAAPEALLSFLSPPERLKAVCVPEVRDALHKARTLTDEEDLICVAGSLYLVGEVREVLLGKLTQ